MRKEVPEVRRPLWGIPGVDESPLQVIDRASSASGVPFRTRPIWQMIQRQPSGGGTFLTGPDPFLNSNVIGSSVPGK
ncbi:MAG: hypothetical protein WCH85_11155 [Methanomicrobiales archaeon]